jgi:hypothetical protein
MIRTSDRLGRFQEANGETPLDCNDAASIEISFTADLHTSRARSVIYMRRHQAARGRKEGIVRSRNNNLKLHLYM